MPASTLMDVLTGALTAIGQLGRGQTANASDAALGLRLANLILSKASAKRLFLPNVAIRQYTLQANVASYTIGPTGATFTAARPTFIESAQVKVPGSTDYWPPLTIADKPKWDAIANRGASDEVPATVYVDYTYPNLTFYVHPKPVGTPVIRFGVWEPLTAFVSVFEEISFPPAYEEWLECEIAVAYSPFYDQPVPDTLANRLAEARATVMQINAQAMGGALSDAQALQSPNVGQPGAA
jgi:hypothetical protein